MRYLIMMIDRRRFLGLAGASLAATQLIACGRDKTPTEGIARSQFDAESTAEDVTAGIDLTGKVAVVTGCTSGIGLETMRVLASRGARVIGSSRSIVRARKACAGVVGVTVPVEMDLGELDSVVACAETIRAMKLPVDMLICNAGYLGGGNDRQLIDGIEKHFFINHLGHFVFVNRLLDRLFIAPQGRIVMISSRTAYTDAPADGILFDDLNFSYDYTDMLAYGHSKLANALFSLRLSELLRGTRITSNSLHPGIIDTQIDRHSNSVMQFGLKMVAALGGKTIEEGAATTCYVATSDALSATSGAYFEDCNAVTVGGRNHLYDLPMAANLVQVSADMTADYLVDQELPTKQNLNNER
jgi:NAD(P)-dependent dehydrogenase (short-subunit alcohol dehydrogenase family)